MNADSGYPKTFRGSQRCVGSKTRLATLKSAKELAVARRSLQNGGSETQVKIKILINQSHAPIYRSEARGLSLYDNLNTWSWGMSVYCTLPQHVSRDPTR